MNTMNRIKLQYVETNKAIAIEFYTMIQGYRVTLLNAKLVAADFEEIKRLRKLAADELNSLDQAMRFEKLAA